MKKKNINLKEFKHYEKHVPMTAKEKKALQSWVAHGNSVHRNFYGAVDEESGTELDFLSVYRDMNIPGSRYHLSANGYRQSAQ